VRAAFAAAAGRLPEGPTRILVLGGSQGSAELNDAVPAALAAADPEHHVKVLHQAGRGRREVALARWQASGHPAEVVEFVDDVAAAMAACHLVVSRAGAITLAELAAVGRGALLVPLAAAGDHQRHNAENFAANGAGVAVTGGAGLAGRLQGELEQLLRDRERLATMHRAAHALHRADAAADIADRLMAVAAGRAA
jgi:UDP-N-acetylglucosamine--N-acetylmuramyl-(pentapeptide) pyrophosphoryl-undecaprenol N-acetylglucosamine transferase